MTKVTRVGVDLAKNVFHVHGVDSKGRKLWQRKLTRSKWIDEVCKKLVPGGEVGMEACASAHHWAREFSRRGFRVRLIAAQFVKPFVKSNKNDTVDAEAISEAMSRPSMRFVTPKTIDQQDLQAMHRIRSELVSHRTAKANQIRGLIGEYGIVAPVGINQLRRAIPCWLEEADNGLTGLFRELLMELWSDLQQLDDRVGELDNRLAAQAKSNPVSQKLLQIKGVGVLTATALTVALGDGSAFRNGRDFAVSLGLTPGQHSTGGKPKLLGISKRGDAYLRKLLIHGARSAVIVSKNREDALSRWIQKLATRKHANVVTVALANKMARIAWALVAKEANYEPGRAAGQQQTEEPMQALVC